MRKWAIATGVAAVALAAAGVAIANHVTQVDAAAVPTGFHAAHNSIDEIPLSARLLVPTESTSTSSTSYRPARRRTSFR